MRFHLLAAPLLTYCISAQTVTITNGTIRGGVCPSLEAAFYHSIPYARPPIGSLRFSAPQPYDQKFNSTLDGTKTAPSCIQFGKLFIEHGAQSEDCLFLNVWVPRNATNSSSLPVKVFIYGGSNLAGGISDPMYDGCNAATDSIIVSINYRLGPLGFLGIETAGFTGNYAVQDLLLGLRWVHENIKAFGGDSKKVLLFGQSAGAALSYAISTLPEAPSLINAVATESGGGRGAIPYAKAQPYFQQFVKNLGCAMDDAECMRAKSTEALQAALPVSSGTEITLAYGRGFAVVIDGNVVREDPAQIGVRVPAILGSTSADGSLFVLAGYADDFPPTQDNYTTFVESNFGALAPTVKAAYPISKFANISGPALAPYFAMTAIWTHSSYTCSAYRGLVKAAQKGIPSFAYLWDTAPTCPWSAQFGNSSNNTEILKLLGATHASEIPYVFRNTNKLPMPSGTCSLTAGERGISNAIASAWTAMAEKQNPNSGQVPMTWPTFDTNKTEGFFSSNVDGVVIDEIDYSFCTLWDKVNEALLANNTGSITNHSSGPSPTYLESSGAKR